MPTFFLPIIYEICYILQRSLVNANTSAFGFLCQYLCLELLQNNKNFSFCWFRRRLFQNCCIVIKTSTCSGCFVLFLECLRLSALLVLVSRHSQICSESLRKAPNSFLQCYQNFSLLNLSEFTDICSLDQEVICEFIFWGILVSLNGRLRS